MNASVAGNLNIDQQVRVFDETVTAAGSMSRELSLQSDTILVTLWVASITGSLDVVAESLTGPGRDVVSITFPTVSAPTADLLIRRAPVTTSRVKITATFTGACSFEIHARAIMAGIFDSRILGAASLRVTQITVGTVPTLLIPAALTDRSGTVIKNWSTSTNTLFVGESAAKAVPGTGYPLAAKDALALDVAAGVSVYGSTDSGTVDLRLAEAGG